ncbi:hypothetical protein, partial [Paraburkholderia humisilvae]|uniref:hypothetical protein n=1 Tax=Paraburkholderia humisilvae TaxID=627669 RepID=UPI001C2ECC78
RHSFQKWHPGDRQHTGSAIARRLMNLLTAYTRFDNCSRCEVLSRHSRRDYPRFSALLCSLNPKTRLMAARVLGCKP